MDCVRHLLSKYAFAAQAVEPLVQVLLIRGLEARDCGRKYLGALRHVIDVVDAKERKADVLAGIVL